MKVKTPAPPVSAGDFPDKSSEPALGQIGQNIETILAFYTREESKMSGPQRVLEAASSFVAQPLFLGCILLLSALWILGNVIAHRLGYAEFDPAPFFWLQGIVSLGALLTATVVLIKQNRLAKLEEQRDHLELQVNLLTEQKVTKLINLIEELRHDLPNVPDRHDPEAVALQQPTDPEQQLAALDERRETGESPMPAGEEEVKVEERKGNA